MPFLLLGVKASLEALAEIISSPSASKGTIKIWSDNNGRLRGTARLDGEDWINEEASDILDLVINMGEAAKRILR